MEVLVLVVVVIIIIGFFSFVALILGGIGAHQIAKKEKEMRQYIVDNSDITPEQVKDLNGDALKNAYANLLLKKEDK